MWVTCLELFNRTRNCNLKIYFTNVGELLFSCN